MFCSTDDVIFLRDCSSRVCHIRHEQEHALYYFYFSPSTAQKNSVNAEELIESNNKYTYSSCVQIICRN